MTQSPEPIRYYPNFPGLQFGNMLYFLLQAWRTNGKLMRFPNTRLLQLLFPKLSDLMSKYDGISPYHEIPESYWQMVNQDFTSVELDTFLDTFILPEIDRYRQEVAIYDLVINIRRTDMYLPHQIEHYGFDVVAYLKDVLPSVAAVATIVIVSDDPDWCRDNLLSVVQAYQPSAKVEIAAQNVRQNFFQLALGARQLILSNSTFGYWAAYIARRLGHVSRVVVPDFNTYLIDHGRQIADTRGWECVPVQTIRDLRRQEKEI